MAKMKNILLVFLFLLCGSVYGQDVIDNLIQKHTYLYAIKDNDSLFLDKYELPSIDSVVPMPCMIYVFGGGFMHGQRFKESYMPYFRHLLEKGFVVISIDYRLGLNKAKREKDLNAQKFISILNDAIDMATEDLYDVTRYVLSYAGDWKIDTKSIVVTGSSAGAITVLHAEYGICNKSDLAKNLPEDFNYAGVVSCAGAIFTRTGGLQWKENPAPMLMFHGDADRNVPYDKVKILQLGLYGSKYISEELNRMKSPYYFYDIENAGHEMAMQPLTDNQDEIDIFLDKLVKAKRPLIIHQKVQQLDKPLMEKNFSIKDYIKANMGTNANVGF